MKSGQFCTLAMFLLCVYCLFHFHLLFFLPCLQSQQDAIIVCIIFSFVYRFYLLFCFAVCLIVTFLCSVFNLSLPGRRYHCFYAPPARLAANLTAGLSLIYEKIANIPNCRCLSSRCGAGKMLAPYIFTPPLGLNARSSPNKFPFLKLAGTKGIYKCMHLQSENQFTYFLPLSPRKWPSIYIIQEKKGSISIVLKQAHMP